MPYIIQDKRAQLEHQIEALLYKLFSLDEEEDNNMEGNLNYVITKILSEIYVEQTPAGKRVKSYRDANNAIGMLESAKTEFYRKFVAPYEEQKEFENGAL